MSGNAKHLSWVADEFFSDVAYFKLCGNIDNQQHFIYLAENNPPSFV